MYSANLFALPLSEYVAYRTGSGLGGVLGCLFLIIWIGSIVLWIWALIDAIKNPSLDSNARLVWVLVIIFVPLLGPILYLTIGRSQ